MSFTTVTPLSKLLAMICFILFPFVAFYLGTQYQKLLTQPTVITSQILHPSITPTVCNGEGKLCPDGTYVFRQAPSCEFALCPTPLPKTSPVPLAAIQKAKTKEDQIILQVSQKSGIPASALTITSKNPAQQAQDFAGGTYSGNNESGWWIAVKTNGIWLVTGVGHGTPSCDMVTPYKYPKTLIPACKNATGAIVAR